MASIRYRINHKNSLNDEVTWRVELIDTTTTGAQTISFDTLSGSISYSLNGSLNDLPPGVYPSTFKLSMMVGTFQAGFIDSLEVSTEKSWVLKAYRDDILEFVGYLLPDECSWEDMSSPYALEITAVDGFQALQALDFSPNIGIFKHKACSIESLDTLDAYTETVISTCITGELGWVVLEHRASVEYRNTGTDILIGSHSATTYVREEVYAIDEPPGTGWIDAGNNLWVRSPAILSTTVFDEAEIYHLQNHIDVGISTLNDVFQRAFDVMDLRDYMDETYYEVLMDVYNDNMKNKTDDPSTMIQVPLEVFEGKKWNEVLNRVCQHHGLRIYQAAGRFRVEQITARANVTPVWFEYNADGGVMGSNSANPILIMADDHIASGGRWTFQPALREVNVSLKLDTDNYLSETYWDSDNQGERLLGLFVDTAAYEDFKFNIKCRSISTFDATTLDLYSIGQWKHITWHSTIFRLYVRAVLRTTGTIYYLEPNGNSLGIWTTTPGSYPFTREKDIWIGVNADTGESSNPFVFDQTIGVKCPAPGVVGDQFDIYMSWSFFAGWHPNAIPSAFTTDDTLYSFFGQSFDNTFYLVDGTGEVINKDIDKVYTVKNTNDNTKVVNIDAYYGDLLYHKQGLKILNGVDKWVKSDEEWGRNGVYDKSFLRLLAEEMMSLRMTPKKIFNGTLYDQTFSMNMLMQRDSYIYLPIRISGNTEMDAWNGEFIQISHTTPPDGVVITNPTDAVHTDVEGYDYGNDVPLPPPLVLETNEVLTSGLSYTECDIVNTLGIYFESGNLVTITDPETGTTQNVTLTADIEPDDIVMYFTSQLFSHTFPDASLITLTITQVPARFPYKYSHSAYNSNQHIFPTWYDLSDISGNAKQLIDGELKIWRNGALMRYEAAGTGVDEYYIDEPNNKVVFPIPFTLERIRIEGT